MGVVFRFIKQISAALVVALFFACAMPMPAHAADYDDDPYGACSFNKECPKTTIVKTTEDLQVAINLVNGQVIPAGTYTIEVTPLNGQGSSFAYVEFFVDGWFAAKFTPDTTGTATYDWNTTQNRGTTLTFKIYGQNGTVTTKEFRVTIADEKLVTPVTPVVNTTSEPPQNSSSGLIEQTIRSLPAPLALSIPYLLYAALLIMLIILLIHARREATEARLARIALTRSRQLAEEKDGFIELVSHYLRTPLTLIKGSADLLATSQPALVARVQAPIASFSASVEQLLTNAMQNQQLQSIDSDVPKKGFLWLTPGLWVVIIVVAVVAAYLNYLLVHAGVTDFSLGSALTQAALFLLLITCSIVVARSQQLRIRDRTRAETQKTQQIAIDEARNNLIRQAASDLSTKLESISSIVPQLPTEETSQLFKEGVARAAEVLKKFRATAQVTPPLSTMPFSTFTLSQALNRVQSYLGDKIQDKHITITAPQQEVPLASQQPSWIVQTLNSVIDNAIAYSPANANIDISVVIEHGTATVYVKDHGQGIPKEKLSQLFQPFSRAEAPTTFDHPGIGLSLYLSRLLMTSLGGDIHIDSTPQAGTLVTLRFPVTETAEPVTAN
jgi:signal transduction histidine kinase